MNIVKANLDGTQPIDKDSLYLIDFSKCTSVNDLMVILSCIGFTFSPYHPGFETLKPFLNLDQPIPTKPQVQAKSISLPQLKSLK